MDRRWRLSPVLAGARWFGRDSGISAALAVSLPEALRFFDGALSYFQGNAAASFWCAMRALPQKTAFQISPKFKWLLEMALRAVPSTTRSGRQTRLSGHSVRSLKSVS